MLASLTGGSTRLFNKIAAIKNSWKFQHLGEKYCLARAGWQRSLITLAYMAKLGGKTLTLACHENLWHPVVGSSLFEDGLRVMTSKWWRGQCPHTCMQLSGEWLLGKHENNNRIIIWDQRSFPFMCNKPKQQTINGTLEALEAAEQILAAAQELPQGCTSQC